MSKGDEDFDLSHAEDKSGKNRIKGSKKPGRPKGTSSKKRKRSQENIQQDSNHNKRVKTSSIKDEDNEDPQQSTLNVKRRQELLQEYNNLK